MSLMRKFCHFLGITITIVFCVVCSPAENIVLDYKLNLSSSGPAIYGSIIKFNAKLLESTGQTPKDEKLFRYEWRSDLDRITAIQHADYNTSLKRCYDSYVLPSVYTMTVTVHSLKPSLIDPIVKQSLNFTITDSLNGKLDHVQSVHHRKGVQNSIFSTQKPISFYVNISDVFGTPPTLTYRWYLNGKSMDASNYANRSLTITESGPHNIKVNVTSDGISEDCKRMYYSANLNGFFEAKFILKNPVLSLELFGKKRIDLGDNTTLTAVFNGSAPYIVCWELLSSNDIVIVNQTCLNVTEEQELNIHLLSEYFAESGSYMLNMSVENDISVYHSRQKVIVNTAPPPTTMSPDAHSPAHVLIPVICALVGVTLLLFAGVYFINRRKRLSHIESANFDFHTSIKSTPRRKSTMDDLKQAMLGLLNESRQANI
ncbi:hypothetical protein ACF0H5_000108 [Mactra antiquata]